MERGMRDSSAWRGEYRGCRGTWSRWSRSWGGWLSRSAPLPPCWTRSYRSVYTLGWSWSPWAASTVPRRARARSTRPCSWCVQLSAAPCGWGRRRGPCGSPELSSLMLDYIMSSTRSKVIKYNHVPPPSCSVSAVWIEIGRFRLDSDFRSRYTLNEGNQ